MPELADQNLPWYDVRDSAGHLFNTVRASDERDALWRSDRQAFVIGIEHRGLTRRWNPGASTAELTPSGGKHPF